MHQWTWPGWKLKDKNLGQDAGINSLGHIEFTKKGQIWCSRGLGFFFWFMLTDFFLGIGMMKRKLGAHDNLKITIQQNGDKFNVKEHSNFRNIEIEFTLGVTFEYSLADGTELSVRVLLHSSMFTIWQWLHNVQFRDEWFVFLVFNLNFTSELHSIFLNLTVQECLQLIHQSTRESLLLMFQHCTMDLRVPESPKSRANSNFHKMKSRGFAIWLPLILKSTT